jgi:hypothetical protein
MPTRAKYLHYNYAGAYYQHGRNRHNYAGACHWHGVQRRVLRP